MIREGTSTETLIRRWLYAYRVVPGRPQRLEEALRTRTSALLAAAAGSEASAAAADGSFTIELPWQLSAVTMGKKVRVTTGVASHSSDDRLRIPVTWHADPARTAFPVFEGTIELEPQSETAAQVTLVGSYQPPLGPAGAALDATVLRGTAERTAEILVDGLTHELSALGQGRGHPAPQDRSGPDNLTVRDVMTADPLVLEESLPVRTAALLLFHYEVSGAPVMAADGALVGVLSEADLLEKSATPRQGLGRAAAQAHRRRTATNVGEACSRPALTTAADTSLRAAARLLRDERVARLVVVDVSRIAGIVTRHDVLRALLRSDAEIAAAIDRLLKPGCTPRWNGAPSVSKAS